jgi:hypothetical protein
MAMIPINFSCVPGFSSPDPAPLLTPSRPFLIVFLPPYHARTPPDHPLSSYLQPRSHARPFNPPASTPAPPRPSPWPSQARHDAQNARTQLQLATKAGLGPMEELFHFKTQVGAAGARGQGKELCGTTLM